MQHIFSKILLLLSIILGVVAVTTPNWQGGGYTVGSNLNSSTNQGLFKFCTSDNINIKNQEESSYTCQSFTPNMAGYKYRKSCAVLAIGSIVLLMISLICDFVPQNNFKQCHTVSLISFSVGVILMIACISLYGDKIFAGRQQSSGILNTKYGYEYSFYLAISSLLLAITSRLAGIIIKG